MSYDWLTLERRLDGYPPSPRHIYFSVCGTGVPWNVGYPFDLGEALNSERWAHQPIGYPATAFPMRPSYTAGETEFARQLALWRCQDRTWGCGGYSQGAIVTSNILDRVRTGDLQQYRDTFIGGVTWGNPRREQGHTIPGGIDPGGHGIVTPNLIDTPDNWWDFAAGAKMVGSPGNDLYTTCGVGEDAQAVADQEAIWKIVDSVSISSLLGPGSLVMEVLGLLANPLAGGIGAVEAILGALNFFGIEGLTPHTSYQFVQPIAGDPRDCWRVALDYLNFIGTYVPARG